MSDDVEKELQEIYEAATKSRPEEGKTYFRGTVHEHIARREALSVEELAALSDEDIDYSDIPELDEDFWKNAKVVPPRLKKYVTICLDLDWNN